MKKRNVLKWIILAIAIAINVFILVNAFINGDASAKESNTIAHGAADVINAVKPETITEENFPRFAFDVRKAVGHFGLFAASGVFTTWSLYLFLKDTKFAYFLKEIGFSFALGISVAAISEIAQLITKDRAGTLLDVGIDVGGYFIGVLPVILILLIRKSPIFLTQKQIENRAK